VWGERLLWRGVSLYQCGRCMKVGDIFADKKLKGKGNKYSAPCQASLSAPHCQLPTFSIFPRYPSVSHDIPRHPTTSRGVPLCRATYCNMGVEGQKAFPGAEHLRRKTMAPQSESAKTLGKFLLTRTYSTLRTLHFCSSSTLHRNLYPTL